MNVKFVYKGKVVGDGQMQQIPRTGDFINWIGINFKIESALFDCWPDGSTDIILHLQDVTEETDKKLRYS